MDLYPPPHTGARKIFSRWLALPPYWDALVRIRHRNLFRRIHRSYLHDHNGDLSKVVLSDLGVRSRVQYAVTSGSGRFTNRGELRAYETELEAFRKPLSEADLGPTAKHSLVTLRKTNPPSDFRWRFSAHRFLESNLIRVARELELDLAGDGAPEAGTTLGARKACFTRRSICR